MTKEDGDSAETDTGIGLENVQKNFTPNGRNPLKSLDSKK